MKQDLDYTPYQSLKNTMLQRIEKAKINRDVSQPKRVIDVQGGFPGGYPPFGWR